MTTKPNETAEAAPVACSLAHTVTGIILNPTTAASTASTWQWIAAVVCCSLASAILAVFATALILKRRQNLGQKPRGGGGAPNPWHQTQECYPPPPGPSSAGATATDPEGGTTSGNSRPDKDPLLTEQRRRRQAAGGIIMGDGDNDNASGVATAAAAAGTPQSRLFAMISQLPWSAVVAAVDINLINALATASASPADPASSSGTAVGPVFVPFTALAEAIQVDRDRLLRLLRYLCTLDITSCSPANPLPTEASAFRLTPMGRLLHDDALTRALVGFQRSPVVARFPENYGEVVRTGQDVHVLAFGMNWNDCMRGKEGYAAAFTGLMRQRYRRIMPAIAEAWDFSATRRVVDVGGGTGALGVAVLSATAAAAQVSPQVRRQPLRFQVLDLPPVVQAAPAVPAEFAGQLEYVGGSFFIPGDIPACADAYVVNGVLHDWPDDHCVNILSNLAAAAAGKATDVASTGNDHLDGRRDSVSAVPVVLVVDHVLRADDPAIDRTIAHDFAMMKFTGRHRTAAEFRELLRRAGLSLRRTVTLSVPNMQLFEAVVASAAEVGAGDLS